nr:MAG TPA: hypothetical protein [Caudoviricetes sp.]
MPDRRRPVSRPPTCSAYHAGDAILLLRWQGDYSLTYNPSAFRLVDFVLFLLVLSKSLPYIG